ncbi:excisionase family DNA binding protein [Streptohalobacillus salinus]|uniref:Excisionase family DNA binding protein n=1 Tax=Streptohalobacillus salinus TaxID=621096 RepID=A0A2V3WE52_9BACI|nr:helix-turn-helix domain-containing protein [Streptohalobacillus salinus]PXW93196.1 excisionase family DNA binding protein [Streptohalobacillus salinus]
MYVDLNEAAEYLDIHEEQVRKLIFEGKIKAHFDGQAYMINTGQFDQYFKNLEKVRAQIQAYLNEPIPESLYVKDED